MINNENKDYLVSAIVSTYNSEAFIRACLENLVSQTLRWKIEIIVVDSASEQNEGDIVREFQKEYRNIQYIRTEKRESLYGAWNRGIKASRGKYIANTNTDDRLKYDALELMSDVLEKMEHVGIVYADQIITNYPNVTFEEKNISGYFCRTDFTIEDLINRSSCGSQVMWRKSLHELAGYFKEEYEVLGDWEFWLRVIFNTSYTAYHIPKLLGSYYNNTEGLEHGERQNEKSLNENLEIKREYCLRTRHALCSLYISHESAEKLLKEATAAIIRKNTRMPYYLVVIFSLKKKLSFHAEFFKNAKNMARRRHIDLLQVSETFNYLKLLKRLDNDIGGRYLALVSDDRLISKSWLEEGLRLFENNTGDVGIMRSTLNLLGSGMQHVNVSSIDYCLLIGRQKLNKYLKVCGDKLRPEDIKGKRLDFLQLRTQPQ